MSSERPPRGRPRPTPKGFDDVPVLSDEEVERRVDVRGGGTPRGPAERPVRASRQPRPPERTVARDSILLIGLVIVGLVAVRLLLPDGPLTGSPTQSPGGSLVVVASVVPSTSAPTRTPSLVTLEPVATPTPGASAVPTATPAPTPTLKPGETPKPTPKPTPKLTAAFLVVRLVPVTDDGGRALASSWTISVTTAGSASPTSFAGSAAGTTVTISAGASYSVSSTGPTGYTQGLTTDCSSTSGGLPVAGATETCTITRDDIKPLVTVRTIVNGGGPESPADWTVTVSGLAVSPGSFAGDSSGVDVRFDANYPFAVEQSNPGATDYQEEPQSGTCTSGGEVPGSVLTCTFVFTYEPPPTEAPPAAIFLAAWAPGIAGLRRWTTHRPR